MCIYIYIYVYIIGMRGVPGAQRLRRGADLPRGGAHPGRRVVDEVQAGLLRPRLPLGVAAAVRRHGGGLPGRRRPGPRYLHYHKYYL